MADLKTRKTDADVAAFIAAIEDPRRRADCERLIELMTEVTGEPPAMWGASMVGFGHYHYVYDSGREGDWFQAGFAPRKQALTLYIMGSVAGREDQLARLGTFKHGKACLYVKRLSDIDLTVLRDIIHTSITGLRTRHDQPSEASQETAHTKPAAKQPAAKQAATKKPPAKKPPAKKPPAKKLPAKKL